MQETTSAVDDDLLELLDDPEHPEGEHRPQERPWRILIVDDDGDVHKAT
jgi:diguanylate cyclase